MCGGLQRRLEFSAHVINLAFDGITGYCAFSPPFGHHGTQPNSAQGKQRSPNIVRFRLRDNRRHSNVQSEVGGTGQRFTGQNGLKLRTGF